MTSLSFRRVAKNTLAAFTMAILCGCASTDTKLPVDLQAVKKQRSSGKERVLNVTEFFDKRVNKSMGISNGKSVDSIDDPLGWIRVSLENRGYRMPNNGDDHGDVVFCNIALELNILDFQTHVTSKSANVVMTLRSDAFPQGKIIRGQFTGTMWIGNDKEVANAIRKSLRRAIDKLDVAARESCASL